MEGLHWFNIERKAVAAGIFDIVAYVSLTYILLNPGNLLLTQYPKRYDKSSCYRPFKA